MTAPGRAAPLPAMAFGAALKGQAGWSRTMRILLLEDHDRLAGYITKGLAAAHIDVDRFTRGADGLAALAEGRYDALLLDLGLPDMDGLTVLRQLRKERGQLPVLILTSRVQVQDRVKGLDAGADDYLTKPFSMEELVARLRALQRRPAEVVDTVYRLANLALDSGNGQVTVQGQTVALSPREMSLLEALIRRQGKVVAKETLDSVVYGMSESVSPNSLEVLVHRLRKRLSDAGADVAIHTVRGVGYLMAAKL